VSHRVGTQQFYPEDLGTWDSHPLLLGIQATWQACGEVMKWCSSKLCLPQDMQD
jgi:hypothetical protein